MKNHLEQLRKTLVRTLALHILKKRERVLEQIRVPMTNEMVENINRASLATGIMNIFTDEIEYKKAVLCKNSTLFTERELEELYKEIEASKKLVK